MLWADDLIMLSLDEETAQKQLNALHNFCNKCGFEVNMDKTKVIITGHEPRGLVKPNFKLGNMNVKYLSLVLNKSGSLKTAQTTLKTNAMHSLSSQERRTSLKPPLELKQHYLTPQSNRMLFTEPQYSYQLLP